MEARQWGRTEESDKDIALVAVVLVGNGLRPARYLTTTDGLVCMMSETGVVPGLDESKIDYKGRLGPGQVRCGDGCPDSALRAGGFCWYAAFGVWWDARVDVLCMRGGRGSLVEASAACRMVGQSRAT